RLSRSARRNRRTTRRFAKQLQRPAQALLERPFRASAGLHPVNGFTRVARSKPEAPKGLENPRPQVRHPRTRGFSVARAIGMVEAKPRNRVAVSDEPAVMNGSMVRATQQYQVCGTMVDSLGARAEMVDVTIAVSAPRNHAAPITTPDQAPHFGRNLLRGARSFAPLGANVEPLRVTGCHGDDVWRDRNGLARRVDRALPAATANGDCDLVIGSARILRTTED